MVAPTVLDSVDPAVGDLDDLVQSNEGRLQRCQLHQQLDGRLEIFLQLRDLLPSSRQTRQLVRVCAILIALEHRQGDTYKLLIITFTINKRYN